MYRYENKLRKHGLFGRPEREDMHLLNGQLNLVALRESLLVRLV